MPEISRREAPCPPPDRLNTPPPSRPREQALDSAPEAAPQRAVYFANMAACSLKLQQPRLAAEQCSCALRIDEGCAPGQRGRGRGLPAEGVWE